MAVYLERIETWLPIEAIYVWENEGGSLASDLSEHRERLPETPSGNA